MSDRHRDEIRKQFSRQAAHFNNAGRTLSSAEYLQWVVGCLELKPDFVVLDVAAGTGHLGRAIAPSVRRVVALDMTQEMLRQGVAEAARSGIGNILFEEGEAEKLPYPDESFDLVVTRLSLHHFTEPHPAIREMVRVCRPGREIGIMDMVSPDDPGLAARYNRLERLRDPSHTRCLTLSELLSAVRGAGLTSVGVTSREIAVDLEPWLEMTGADPEVRRTIHGELTEEIDGGPPTGMRPFGREGRLMFLQRWTTVIGVKQAV